MVKSGLPVADATADALTHAAADAAVDAPTHAVGDATVTEWTTVKTQATDDSAVDALTAGLTVLASSETKYVGLV